jgi:hypothetical protein
VKEHQDFIKPLLEGKNIGLMSEAGCPGVADPGAVIVKLAHEKGIQVVFSRSFFDFCHDGIWNERPSFTHVIYPLKKGEKVVLKNLEKISLEKISLKFLLKLLPKTIKCWKISYRLYILKPICVLLILLYQNISKRREHLPGKRKHRSAQ